MKMVIDGKLMRITELKELGAANATLFRDQVRNSVPSGLKLIEIDLSRTSFIDSCGLGSLIALHKTMCARNGLVRLLNPTAPVQQILELTRMHRIFEIAKR
ncbi:MAG TPA: STAS domain-containing protein [Candidatus Paceibacterota bacterium]|nr:STAS domain-containing protein [Verrucomicrobiota bacterium]HRY49287.1 STAS domain-containing protein [Candidatus Paceibacterota bacterium]HSA01069.1 STAS domain-containing protein [Candidatus Paceibacterota bacterium]